VSLSLASANDKKRLLWDSSWRYAQETWLILQNFITFLPYAYVITEGNVRSQLGDGGRLASRGLLATARLLFCLVCAAAVLYALSGCFPALDSICLA